MTVSEHAIVDRRSLLKGAVAVGAASAVVLGSGTTVVASTVALDPAPGQGVANRAALQAAILATPAHEVLQLPAGTFEVDITSGGLTLPQPITIAGSGTTTLDVLPKAPSGSMSSLFTVPTSVSTGHFGFDSFRIAGPTSTGGGGSAIEWVRLGSSGTLSLRKMVIEGQFQFAVRRSGVGLVHLAESHLSARNTIVQFTDNGSGAGPSRCVVFDCVLDGSGARVADYGIELPSHIALQCAATELRKLDVFAFSVSGGASSPVPTWTVTRCTLVDAALGNTGPTAHAVFDRVVQTVSPSWVSRQSTLAGPATFLDCDLRGDGGFLLGSAATVEVRFQTCRFKPKGALLTAGSSLGQAVFDGCTWELSGGAQALYLASSFSGAVRLRRSGIFDCGTPSTNLSLYGGTTTYVSTTIDSPKANHGVSANGGATIIGSPTLANTGSCPVLP